MRCFVATKTIDEETPLRDTSLCVLVLTVAHLLDPSSSTPRISDLLDDAVVDVKQTHNSAALAVDEDISGDKRNGRGPKSVRFDVRSPPLRREDFFQKHSRGFNNVVPRFIVGALGRVTELMGEHLTEIN